MQLFKMFITFANAVNIESFECRAHYGGPVLTAYHEIYIL